jgi:hypothetical protein
MNKQELLQRNVVPDGQAAWLTYTQYLELKRLFEAAPLPSDKTTYLEGLYLELYRFLTEVAGLVLPPEESSIHFNAFALLRRGYQVESITQAEYDALRRLMADLEEPAVDDLELYEIGGHRALYNYLTRVMGLPVQKGRGPAWHRANILIKTHEEK